MERTCGPAMIDQYAQTKFALWQLSREIYEYAYERYSLPSEWNDNEIVITSNSAGIAEQGVEQLTITSSATRELFWLFARLREAFAGLINGPSMAQFYTRLARAINNHEMTVDSEHRVNSTLRAVMDEAALILEQLETGTLQILPVNEFRPFHSQPSPLTTVSP